MNRSDELGELATALSAAQGEFEAVAKDATNPFFKSKYADLPAVVEAASPILVRHGLAVTQLLGHDEQGDTLTTVLLHKSGQFIGDTMHLRPVKNDPQAQGSATTYGRRYAYMAALGLVADEDDDGNAGSGGARKAKPAARPTPKPAPKSTAAPKADPPAASETQQEVKAELAASLVDGKILDQLREMTAKAGWDLEKLSWALIEVGVETLPSPPSKKDIGAAMAALTLDQAMRLFEKLDAEINGGADA